MGYRSCKIVGTIGPASSQPDVLAELFAAGLNVVRMNFSHGDHKTHLETLQNVRKVAEKKGHSISILLDLQGPKIRCGRFAEESLKIELGQEYELVYGLEQSHAKMIPIDYSQLVSDVKVDDRVLMDDGLLSFKITKIKDQSVFVTALVSGILKPRKGVNFPDSILSLPCLTEKDSKDLLFGIANRVDFFALSFVQKPQDIVHVKSMIKALGSDIPVVAKIEKLSAVETIDGIAELADGLMVARGDLGVEAGIERVPGFQRRIVEAAHTHAIPVIIATQMLESMINNPRATLAEVADVANGVLDGADALMLSGEMATGRYPVACVQQMAAVIKNVEAWAKNSKSRQPQPEQWQNHEAIAKAACEAAEQLPIAAIVCLTLTGNIAKTISRWRPNTRIIAMSPRQDVINRLVLSWGVTGILNPLFYNTDKLLADLPKLLREMNLVESGQNIIITAGIPINTMAATNMLKINRIP
jgi:pyruvate kinase